MRKPPLSHFSPKFTNKAWADENGYISYFSCPFSSAVKKSPKGWKQWGRKRGLYTWEVETNLNENLENEAGVIYQKICSFKELTPDERVILSQFLLSQLVRTPTFMKYEKKPVKYLISQKSLSMIGLGVKIVVTYTMLQIEIGAYY